MPIKPKPQLAVFIFDATKPIHALVRQFRRHLNRPDVAGFRVRLERRLLPALLGAGQTVAECSRLFGVSESTIRHWQYRDED